MAEAAEVGVGEMLGEALVEGLVPAIFAGKAAKAVADQCETTEDKLGYGSGCRWHCAALREPCHWTYPGRRLASTPPGSLARLAWKLGAKNHSCRLSAETLAVYRRLSLLVFFQSNTMTSITYAVRWTEATDNGDLDCEQLFASSKLLLHGSMTWSTVLALTVTRTLPCSTTVVHGPLSPTAGSISVRAATVGSSDRPSTFVLPLLYQIFDLWCSI